MGILDENAINEKRKEGERSERARLRKERREKMKRDGLTFWADFKKFITKGNVLDMAVAVVVASAFNAIVNGLVKNIITPIMTYFTSGVSIEEWKYVLKEAVLDAEGAVVEAEVSILYGIWIQTIVDFLIIAFSIFVAVRVIRKAERAINAREIAKQEALAAEKKAAEDAAAAKIKEEADLIAKEEKALRDEFYQNVREQSELLKKISESIDKKQL